MKPESLIVRAITFDPIGCEACGKHKPLYFQEWMKPWARKKTYEPSGAIHMDRCKDCIYQDINRIYEERERVMSTRIDYYTAPGRARLLPVAFTDMLREKRVRIQSFPGQKIKQGELDGLWNLKLIGLPPGHSGAVDIKPMG